ncbi:hypothetical protein G6F46_002163 [Rhizopus delemar]|uniref:Autophagy-related protein 6 n=2 Tax=Rhizopus TaxID=4842 RepID=A0A9P7CUF4_9FUNG|nr:hypothetical protein G6F43_003448 [Rhizopus delemar]KAG1552155.1 hypothetical protein G6F51_001405 [Rhizopus arrhizus]KAG1460147.1 hypothetical protein G6F55_004342 [Rhizopus delemar]KAG1493910.1 hypothetical protein G6F54_008249 [Rhizopus delemar]KAG1517735.1 hypothetical protein G6F53_001134 [Rhizopus delemar]
MTFHYQATADMLIAPLLAEGQFEAQEHQKRAVKQVSFPDPMCRKPMPTEKRKSYPIVSESFVMLPHPNQQQQQAIHRPILASKSTNTVATVTTPTHVEFQTTVEEANWTRNNSLSHRLKVANRLFDIMSSQSNVDHPLCQECTDMLLEALEKQLEDVSRERDCYIEFMKKVKDSRLSNEEEQELRKQLEELQLAEEEASAELQKLQEEEKRLEKELEGLENQVERLDDEEDEFWEKCNEYQLNLDTFQNERDSINLKYDHDVKQYDKLQKTVVYNDAFCISHDGPFGTINGFRLGRLSTHPVEWNEINAAWGQTLLLLYTIANKLKFQFQNYRLVPMGSFSRVEKVGGDSVISYELYGTGDFGLNRMFLNRRFDHAMVAILSCLKQLADFAEEKDKSLRLPYRINKDKIGDLSIRLQFNQDESWTKALRYMLTNMKWILVFASRANTANESETSAK